MNNLRFRYLFSLYLIVAYILCSFVSARNVSFRLLTPFVSVDDNNLLFCDYFVYGTERRFNEGLITDVPAAKDRLKESGDAVVFKIPGRGKHIVFSDYSIVYDENVPELNIEIYVAKNIAVGKISLPFVTAETLIEHYLPLALLVFFSAFFLPTAFLCFHDIRKRRLCKAPYVNMRLRRSDGLAYANAMGLPCGNHDGCGKCRKRWASRAHILEQEV